MYHLPSFPYGTLFATALGTYDDRQIAGAVEAGTAGEVDLALVNGVAFLNTVGIGGYPSLVKRRDGLSCRLRTWPPAAYALHRTLRHHLPLQLEIGDRTFPTWMVFIGNGAYRPRGLAPSGVTTWRPDRST